MTMNLNENAQMNGNGVYSLPGYEFIPNQVYHQQYSMANPYQHGYVYNNGLQIQTHQNRTVRFCYGCGETGHLHKDCPRDQLFCYNCNQNGYILLFESVNLDRHSSKNCKQPKPWENQVETNTPTKHQVSSSQPNRGGYQNISIHPQQNQYSSHLNISSPLSTVYDSGTPKSATIPRSADDPWNMRNLEESVMASPTTPNMSRRY